MISLLIFLGVVAGLSPLIALNIENRFITLALVGIIVIIVLALILTKPELGILILVATATMVPYGIGTGTASSIVAALVFAAFLMVAWIGRMLIHHSLVIRRSPINLPLLGFVVTTIISTIYCRVELPSLVSAGPTFSLVQIGGVAVIIISAGMLWVTMNTINSLRWVQWLTYLFLAISLVSATYRILFQQNPPGFETGGLFSMWVIALSFSQAIFNDKMPKWARGAMAALALVTLGIDYIQKTAWISGWLPGLVVILIIPLLRSKRLFLAIMAIAIFFMSTQLDSLYASQVTGSESQGNQVRLEIWSQNLEIAKDHPLLGTGIGGYTLYYATFLPNILPSSHCNYLDILSQTGVIGFAFFIWFLGAVVKEAFSARKRWQSGFASGFSNGVLAALVGITVAMVLGDWFIPYVYNQTIAGFRYTIQSWLFIGAMASLNHIQDTKYSND